LARRKKLIQRLIPYTTELFSGAKLTARLFHGMAKSFAVSFPGVPFWLTVASFSSTQKSANSDSHCDEDQFRF
jgi:hypothetical protein